MSLAAVGTAAAVVSVGSSIVGGMAVNKEAKQAAKDQARLRGAQRDEEIRQKRVAARLKTGAARSAIYASNLQESGSSKKYAAALDYENMREIAFAQHAKHLEEQAIREGAQGAGDALFYQAAGDAIGFAVQAYSQGAFKPAADTTTTTDSSYTPEV